MADLDGILRRYTVHGDDTKDRLLGGAFVAVNKDGELHASADSATKLAGQKDRH